MHEVRKIYLFATASMLAACTQQPAQIVLRGGETFTQNTASVAAPMQVAAASAPVAVQPGEQLQSVAAPVTPVDQHTVSVASVGSVASNDLPPPSPDPIKAAKAEPVKSVSVKSEPVKTAAVELKHPAKTVSKEPPKLAKADTNRVRNPYIWPVAGGKVTAKFGPAGKGRANDGITIAADSGEPVYAAADGEVVFVGDQLKGYGNMVLIKHKAGMNSTYAHLARSSVSRYDRVKQGDIIGYVGSSGRVKQPQLYFSMRDGTKPVDPQRYLASRYAER